MNDSLSTLVVGLRLQMASLGRVVKGHVVKGHVVKASSAAAIGQNRIIAQQTVLQR